MSNIVASPIPSMNTPAIDMVRKLENMALKFPQVNINTDHVIHGGMYARTIMIPAGVLLTGALIKVATVLIVSGDVIVYMDSETVKLCGYNVFSASANRKQAFLAITDVYITTVFPTEASTVTEAEEQFTTESNKLMSRSEVNNNRITITGE